MQQIQGVRTSLVHTVFAFTLYLHAVVLQAMIRQIFQGFLTILRNTNVAKGEKNFSAATDEESAFEDYTLACLKSFIRRYFTQVAGLSLEFEDDLQAANFPSAELAAAIRAQLFM